MGNNYTQTLKSLGWSWDRTANSLSQLYFSYQYVKKGSTGTWRLSHWRHMYTKTMQSNILYNFPSQISRAEETTVAGRTKTQL
jgi:hypothetical protein